MKACDADGPLMVNITKLYPKPDCSAFDALGRVLSGTLRTGQRVRVLGEAYSPDDEEDMAVKEVTKLWVYQARYRLPLAFAPAGTWVLIEGVDASITKTATLCEEFSKGQGTAASPSLFTHRVPCDQSQQLKPRGGLSC